MYCFVVVVVFPIQTVAVNGYYGVEIPLPYKRNLYFIFSSLSVTS